MVQLVVSVWQPNRQNLMGKAFERYYRYIYYSCRS